MSTPAEVFRAQASCWGQGYEIGVKRGVLTRLLEQGLVSIDDPRLIPWRQCKLAAVVGAIKHKLQLLDFAMRGVIDAAAEHLALCAFGAGYTAMREYLRQPVLAARLAAGKLTVRGLYCPLTLPGQDDEPEQERRQAQIAFAAAFGIQSPPDPAWTDKGQPARADFLLWLSGEAPDDYLLVQEYSYDMPGELHDFRAEGTHLEELLYRRRLLETRGVFSRVTAEVDEERFELSTELKNHLLALTSQNKPLYKLCQAGAYGEATVRVLRSLGLLRKPCWVRALAITPNGLESLGARFTSGAAQEPRRKLMEEMGAAYRQATRLQGADEFDNIGASTGITHDPLTTKVQEVFNSTLRRLPSGLRLGIKALQREPLPGEDFKFEFAERIPDLINPARRFPLDRALGMVPDTPELTAWFGRPARDAIRAVLGEMTPTESPTLRDLHAAAIVAGMRAARRGRLTVLALEGNPGIGKTTAVTRDLADRTDGYLFMYLSPRVVINRDVTDKMARRGDELTGTLTLTTNAALIAAADRYHRSRVEAGEATPKTVLSAVVADGVRDLRVPDGPTLVLTPEDEEEIQSAHAAGRVFKRTLSENEDLIEDRHLPGVLTSVAQTARELLELNPEVSRVALTAALQGFRDKGGGQTTLDALSGLFRNKNAASRAGVEERREFAKRHPTVVVMVDELAGDGAGAPFVHAVSRWLAAQFIECFEDLGQDTPFTVILVIADASLANEVVLDRYLNASQSGQRAPDKVLISPSDGAQAFRLLANEVRVGQIRRPTLHVMTNSFPASTLDIRYRVTLSEVPLVPVNGVEPSPRKAIRDAMGEILLDSAATEILKALSVGAQQVIYFAQDKAFLGALRKWLVEKSLEDLHPDDIAILDASVPGPERKRLIEPLTRDRKRVFLMTSSGARGVSFPKTDWIIAHVPRFAIECALMEISQLVYRGRGNFKDASGKWVSGDHVPRHLVMLVDDYLVSNTERSPRQWLRQATDLLTLLVMLRSTLLTRMTGDSGLRQKIAFVPVGGTGVSEMFSLMAQFVSQFLRECDVFIARHPREDDTVRLLKRAQSNVAELFASARLRGEARKGADGRSYSRADEVRRLLSLTSNAIAPLLTEPASEGGIADHMFFAGSVVLENWAHFDKVELFTFEAHDAQTADRARQLYAQLKEIDSNRGLPDVLRGPAYNLGRVLARQKSQAAQEFNTLKRLNSANTWVAFAAGYPQFVSAAEQGPKGMYRCGDPELWRDALGATMSAQAALIPPIAEYASFPWTASVGCGDPMRWDQVFDDRYFMASSELNLLNTLLLEDAKVE